MPCALQVQLVKCLDKSRQAAPLRCRQQKCPGSPVVRPAVAEPGCGMLTDRQMAWVDEFPNEPATENPVLRKYVIQRLAYRVDSCAHTSCILCDIEMG